MSLLLNRMSVTSRQILLGCLMFVGSSCANSETAHVQSLNVEKTTEQLCASISGVYQFFGKTDGETNEDSFIGVLFGKPLIKGEPTKTELIHNVENNVLRVKVSGKDIEPVPDFTIALQCVAGVLRYEYFQEGQGDGSSYKMKSAFRFYKDDAGALIVHKNSSVKSTNLLFFWKETHGDAITRFLPLKINGSGSIDSH